MADSEIDQYLRAARRHDRIWVAVGGIAVAIAVVIGLVILGVINHNVLEAGDDRANEALRSSGFRAVELGDSDPLACAKNESSRHFTATNPLGARVTGTVCCGLTGYGKGCTLRWGR